MLMFAMLVTLFSVHISPIVIFLSPSTLSPSCCKQGIDANGVLQYVLLLTVKRLLFNTLIPVYPLSLLLFPQMLPKLLLLTRTPDVPHRYTLLLSILTHMQSSTDIPGPCDCLPQLTQLSEKSV